MKIVLLTLPLTSNTYIEYYFPDIHNKYNYAHDAQDFIEGCDQVTVAYYHENDVYIIYQGMISDSLRFLEYPGGSKEKFFELPENIDVGMMGYALNKANHEELVGIYSDVKFSKFFMWSTSGSYQTFMYTHKGLLYLEIGYSYPWLMYEPDANVPGFIPYEDFMSSYKPLLVTTLSKEKLHEWREKGQKLFNEIC